MDDWHVTLHRLETPVQQFIDQDKSPTYDSPGHRSETFEFDPVGSTHIPAKTNTIQVDNRGQGIGPLVG